MARLRFWALARLLLILWVADQNPAGRPWRAHRPPELHGLGQGVEQLEGSSAIGALAYFTKSHPQRHGTG